MRCTSVIGCQRPDLSKRARHRDRWVRSAEGSAGGEFARGFRCRDSRSDPSGSGEPDAAVGGYGRRSSRASHGGSMLRPARRQRRFPYVGSARTPATTVSALREQSSSRGALRLSARASTAIGVGAPPVVKRASRRSGHAPPDRRLAGAPDAALDEQDLCGTTPRALLVERRPRPASPVAGLPPVARCSSGCSHGFRYREPSRLAEDFKTSKPRRTMAARRKLACYTYSSGTSPPGNGPAGPVNGFLLGSVS